MTRTAVVPGQDSLFGPAPAPPPLPPPVKRVRPRNHPSRARRDKTVLAQPCEPRCLVCGQEEGYGYCTPRCAVVCQHAAQPDRVEVCLLTTRVTARLIVGLAGSEPGRRLAVVVCPWCERLHWHAPVHGTKFRISGCGRPYLVHLPRPRIEPAAPTVEHVEAAARGAEHARQLLRKDPT